MAQTVKTSRMSDVVIIGKQDSYVVPILLALRTHKKVKLMARGISVFKALDDCRTLGLELTKVELISGKYPFDLTFTVRRPGNEEVNSI